MLRTNTIKQQRLFAYTKQELIIKIVSEILGQKAETDTTFEWQINTNIKTDFDSHFNTINKIVKEFYGDSNSNITKKTVLLDCDAYFGNNYNFMFEFDSFQHFSSARLRTLNLYPEKLKLGYNLNAWKCLCGFHEAKANKYTHNKLTISFNLPGNRANQMAYLDCLRDLLPEANGLNPTIRINEFEVAEIHSNNIDSFKKIEHLLREKIK